MKTLLQFIFTLCFVTSVFAEQQLIIEPDLGRAPIFSFINQAKNSLNLVMYGFTDQPIMDALIHAKKEGKKIAILLEPNPYKTDDENQQAFQTFRTANIPLLSPNPDVKLTHQKTLTADQQQALIMTFNFTRSSFSTQRNFGLVIDDPAMIAEILHVFNADTQHKKIAVNQPNLVWSPDNSREKILGFISQAHHDIKIYAQDVSDYQVVGLLANMARQGKKIEILTNESKQNRGKFAYLRKAGVIIHFSKSYFVHAKVIIADDERALLGSINLTYASLNENRELAVITKEKAIVEQLTAMFQHDFD